MTARADRGTLGTSVPREDARQTESYSVSRLIPDAKRCRKALLCWLALLPLIGANLFPFLVMLATAVKPGSEVLSAAPSWLPSDGPQC